MPNTIHEVFAAIQARMAITTGRLPPLVHRPGQAYQLLGNECRLVAQSHDPFHGADQMRVEHDARFRVITENFLDNNLKIEKKSRIVNRLLSFYSEIVYLQKLKK